MILNTMTYEEIYREISDDFRDVVDYHKIALEPKIKKIALKSKKYPYYRIDDYTHPRSRNKYHFLSIVKKHSLWDRPEMTLYCDYESKYGKEIITAAIGNDIRTFRPAIMISVFQSHFIKRYSERFLKDSSSGPFRIEILLARNTGSFPIDRNAVSPKELAKEDPDYYDEALLNLDGLCLCKRNKKNPNIILYKTFIAGENIFLSQFEKVIPYYIQLLAHQAAIDYPQCEKTIDKIYREGVQRCREVFTGGNDLSQEEQIQTFLKEYKDACIELSKYIII